MPSMLQRTNGARRNEGMVGMIHNPPKYSNAETTALNPWETSPISPPANTTIDERTAFSDILSTCIENGSWANNSHRRAKKNAHFPTRPDITSVLSSNKCSAPLSSPTPLFATSNKNNFILEGSKTGEGGFSPGAGEADSGRGNGLPSIGSRRNGVEKGGSGSQGADMGSENRGGGGSVRKRLGKIDAVSMGAIEGGDDKVEGGSIAIKIKEVSLAKRKRLCKNSIHVVLTFLDQTGLILLAFILSCVLYIVFLSLFTVDSVVFTRMPPFLDL